VEVEIQVQNSNVLLKNEKGIALLLVLGVLTVLSFVLFEFTFETKLNKIKIYNQQDRFQARLNAEAGLNFAMAKLRLYQEGRNMIEKNESLKTSFPSSDLENLIIEPFVYPIPLSPKANIIQKTALKEFEKNTIIQGEIGVTFTKISGLLNPNSLRIVEVKKTSATEQDKAQEAGNDGNQNEADQAKDDTTDAKGNKKNKWESARNLMIKNITRIITSKMESSEEFHTKYSNLKPEDLVNELSYYVNDSSKVTGQDFSDAKTRFDQKGISPKHGPMASLEELHLLPSWDDDLVELFKDRMSVHDLTSIPVNEMTVEDLKTIFEEINNIQIEEFFKYRDGDVDKKIKGTKFKSADDFKTVIVSKLNIVSDSEYQAKIQDLKNAGLVIDTSGKLYLVNSKGTFNNAAYTIKAIVDLPVKEQPIKKTNTPKPNPDGAQASTDGTTTEGQKDGDKTKSQPSELLQPRVVEIQVE
jgi:uncharacterized protein (DUF433 family)